jgi:hypothetical protein
MSSIRRAHEHVCGRDPFKEFEQFDWRLLARVLPSLRQRELSLHLSADSSKRAARALFAYIQFRARHG